MAGSHSVDTTAGGVTRREAVRAGVAAVVGGAVPRSLEPAPVSRAARATRIRVEAANRLRAKPVLPTPTNGDDVRHADHGALFSKGLPHDQRGRVDPEAWGTFKRALDSGRPEDFEAIRLGVGDVKLVDPQAAYAFALEGPDAHALPMPAPPAVDSAEQAAEACELYWQALCRDVPFDEYGSDALVAQACDELSRLGGFAGPRSHGLVTPATVFRGHTPGDLSGPYISQFLWKEVPYGAIRVEQRVRTATPGLDYLTGFDDWLNVQNGAGTPAKHSSTYRYIRSARDLAAYVQIDFTYQAFLTAALVLFGMEGTTDVRRAYKGAPYDKGNPYRGSETQSGFATFGVGHVLDLLPRVATAALRASWYQKWLKHLRLRPEEYGGRAHVARTGRPLVPLHRDILDARCLDLVFEKHGTYLLPQAFPEGAPLHPSYPAGHAIIAGACATLLKVWFDESFPIDEPVVAGKDGLTLLPYRGDSILTVGGELDKLASNISIGRNMAGIHWRSDGVEGMKLGEAVALELLAELKGCFNEDCKGLSLTRFDGTMVTVSL